MPKVSRVSPKKFVRALPRQDHLDIAARGFSQKVRGQNRRITERFIEIPEEVQQIYKIWRPSPLYRASRLEKALDTPARIFFKYEGVSPAGSHKPNTSVPQAYYNKQAGIRRLLDAQLQAFGAATPKVDR